MFNGVYERARRKLPVRVEIQGEAPVDGLIAIPPEATLASALNGDGGFLEFEVGGERAYLAKSAVRRVTPLPDRGEGMAPRPASFALEGRFASEDPRVVLGVRAGESDERVRHAYHALARSFHPDRLESQGLPGELVAYAGQVLAAINAAFAMLERERRARRAA